MDTQQSSTPNEDLQTIVSQLPVPVQEFFASGKSEIVARNLMQKNQLHIDQGAVVEREIIMLLLGLKNPDEFAASLKSDAALTDDVVRSIMADVNQKIFVPLREEMRKAGVGVEPSTPPTRRPEIPSVKPEAGVAKPTSFFHLENKLAPPATGEKQVPKLVVPSRPTEAPQSARPALRDALAAITGAPKQLESRKLLEDHEEPSPSLKAAHTSSETSQGTAQGTVKAPPPVAPSPTNLPGAVPPHPIPAGARYTPPVVPPAPLPPPPKAVQDVAPTPVTKAYTADPYREPIEP